MDFGFCFVLFLFLIYGFSQVDKCQELHRCHVNKLIAMEGYWLTSGVTGRILEKDRQARNFSIELSEDSYTEIHQRDQNYTIHPIFPQIYVSLCNISLWERLLSRTWARNLGIRDHAQDTGDHVAPFLYFKLSPSFRTLTVNATLLKGTYPSLTPFLVSCYILESTTDCSGGEELSLLGAFPFPFPDLRV